MNTHDQINSTNKLTSLIEFARMLLPATYEETLNIVATMGKEISCADRCSLIIQNKKGEFTIKAGVPRKDHRIGYRIGPEDSAIFKDMLERGNGLISIRDLTLPFDVLYAFGLNHHDTKPLLCMPLHYRGQPIGLIVFSYMNGDHHGIFPIDIHQRIKALGAIAAAAIGAAFDRKRREKEVAKKERLTILGENSANVAHIIRNSLTCIGGFANRLHSNLHSPDIINGNLDKAREYSEIILKEIRKLEKIANDVLSYTRFASRKLNLENCNINHYLTEFTNRYRNKFLGLQINFYPDSHDVTVCIDKIAFEACLENLIRNAIEARAKNVVIKTKIKAKDRRLSIAIINDGDKICQNIIDRIFDPFMTTKPDGTGLGLANTQAIIAAHNGDISAISEDHKTEFKILLPITVNKEI